MASVNLKNGKCGKGKALYGIPRHNYRDSTNHSNKDIDPSRSHLNKHYGPQSSAEFRDRLRAMIKAADEEHPPKRQKQDRKVMLTAVIPSPREGMSAEDEARWSAKTYEVMTELFGDQIVGATYHADEIHKYTDPHDMQEHMSRGHTHYSLLPWTDAKGLNMDAFYKRTLPNKINEALDKACMEMFGIPYRDGSQKKSRGTVEQLKLESTIAEREQVEAQIAATVKATQQGFDNLVDEHVSYYKRARVQIEQDPIVAKAFADARKTTQQVKDAWSKYRTAATRGGRRYWAQQATKLQIEAQCDWQEAYIIAEQSRSHANMLRQKAEIKKEIDELLNPHIADFKRFCEAFEALSEQKQAEYRERFEVTKAKNKQDVKDMSKYLTRRFGSKQTMEYEQIKAVQADRREMNKLTNQMHRDAQSDAKSMDDDVDAILADAAATERAARTYTALKAAAKGEVDIDDLLDDDFELC